MVSGAKEESTSEKEAKDRATTAYRAEEESREATWYKAGSKKETQKEEKKVICPYCQQKMPEPSVNLPSVWIESEIVTTDFTTITDAPDTWTTITDFTTLDANGSYYYLSNLP